MAFSKSFAKNLPGTRYPEWIEINLTGAEENKVEALAREEHLALMKECLSDAKQILKDEELKDFQTNLVSIAITLFDKRASHVVWHKEEAARIKFEKEHKP